MKKVIVIGCPGSGKSTFSRALHEMINIPLHHLDLMYWNADKTTAEKPVFLERLKNVLQGDEWIIDGNYASTMELRIQACDTVFFLDYPLDVCLDGIKSRKGLKRSDMPWMEEGEDDAEFIKFIKEYRLKSRPHVMELLDQYACKRTYIFSNRIQAEEFLKQLNEIS